MQFYIVKTNPRQNGEHLKTVYTQTLIYSNITISKEELKILVNKCLNIPFYALWIPSYGDPTELADNIVIEEVNDELTHTYTRNCLEAKINDRYYFEDFLRLEFALKDDYRRTFPENFKFIKVTKENMLDIIKGLQEIKSSQYKAKSQEDLKLKLANQLNKLDKETLVELASKAVLQMMSERSKLEKRIIENFLKL